MKEESEANSSDSRRLSGTVSNLTLGITNNNGRFGGSYCHPVTRESDVESAGLKPSRLGRPKDIQEVSAL